MRKVALVDYGKLVLQDNCGDIKALEPGTVKIDVMAYSIYGGDIALYRGKCPFENEKYFGHEFSGVVADPGDGVNGIRKGIRAANKLSRVYGHCWSCRNGLPDCCRSMNDAPLPGGLSGETPMLDTPEYSFISPAPDTIDDITVALLGPTDCAYHMVRRVDVKYGETAIVSGMGPMRLIAIRIIKNMGVDVVAGMDNSKACLEKVQSLGFTDVINSNDGNWQDQISEMCGSKGADVIIEFTGALPALQSTFRVVRSGGRIVMGSIYSGSTDQVELLPIMRRGLTILGSKGPYPRLKTDGTSAAVDILVRFQDDLKRLVTVYDYKDTPKTFSNMIPGFVIKPTIRFRP